ncbi:MAG: CerR family C-terminal domain-containing protein [Burkholderiales bacterium]|jgi:AcrR family transcriptional regulator|nr:CerR family C-terminal domain-containing protein [Burkholderiales bacterium]
MPKNDFTSDPRTACKTQASADNVPDDTRRRLILAGLAAFDQYGFNGASTRQIAAEAGTNISSIAYYFGSKEKLYLAVAEYIAEEVGNMIKEFEDSLGDKISLIKAGLLPPEEAIVLLQEVWHQWLRDVLLTEKHTHQWCLFLLREQSNPTEAFDILYEKGIGRFLETLGHLVGCVEQCPATSFSVRFHAFLLFGHMLAFEIKKETMKRFFDWKNIDEKKLRLLTKAINAEIAGLVTSPDSRFS